MPAFLPTRRELLLAGAAGATVLGLPRPAKALLQLDITQGVVQPMPIALPDFVGGSGADAEAGRNVTQVITADLKRSGLFAPIAPQAFIERITNFDQQPRYPDWRVINAQALVTGRMTRQPDGRLRAEFRLWDVFGGSQLAGQQYFTTPENWRRVAHIIADAIYERLTGEKGYFDTRIVFVDESGPKERRVKRLAVMDQDGANVRYLSRGDEDVITPRFSPTSQDITYMAMNRGAWRVFLMNIETGQREAVGNFPGMTLSPRFSPDGQRVVFSAEQGGVTSIHVMDLRSKQVSRLSSSGAIDIAPCYSPDGRQIVFASDRGGSVQLYVMGADGSGQRRLSFGEGSSYTTPVWSPRGDLIAFTKQGGGQFAIGVMRTDGSGERILSAGYHNEGPTWAPNGRVVMFWRDPGGAGGPQLYTVDLTGQNEQRVPTPSFASDPAWSPLLS